MTKTANQAAAAGLATYVPGIVIDHLAAGQSAFMAELRRLSVMFVDLPTLTTAADTDDAQRLVVSIQETLRRYEGHFHKLSIDDKGVKLIGVFGLPPLSHEDDPVRTVLAGREILERGGRAARQGLHWNHYRKGLLRCDRTGEPKGIHCDRGHGEPSRKAHGGG